MASLAITTVIIHQSLVVRCLEILAMSNQKLMSHADVITKDTVNLGHHVTLNINARTALNLVIMS